MMKDQFANYVVQKVLETCDDQQLELLLNRIKVHLNALKKYTYGKHIVARVEKLVAAGGKFFHALANIFIKHFISFSCKTNTIIVHFIIFHYIYLKKYLISCREEDQHPCFVFYHLNEP